MNYGMDYQGGGGGSVGGGRGGGMFGGGGGFGSSSQGSPSRGTSRSSDEQSVQPVTIRMVLAAKPSADGSLQLDCDDRKLYHVKIVGAIRSIIDNSTNVVFSIEDGTGLVDVKQWTDPNVPTRLAELGELVKKENIYVKVVGKIKSYEGNTMIVVDSIRPLSTGNELAHHMLEVVYTGENFKRSSNAYAPVPQTKQEDNYAYAPMPQPKQEDNTRASAMFVKNQSVRYFHNSSGEWLDAQVVGVHDVLDDPYYTIQYQRSSQDEKVEIQITGDRLELVE